MGIVIYSAWVVAIFVTFFLVCMLLVAILYPILKAKGYDEPIFPDEKIEKHFEELGCRLDFIFDCRLDFICDVLAETPAGKRIVAEHPELLEEPKEESEEN